MKGGREGVKKESKTFGQELKRRKMNGFHKSADEVWRERNKKIEGSHLRKWEGGKLEGVENLRG